MIKVAVSKKEKACVICGKVLKVITYSDESYRGGHFFGKIPVHTKKALREAMKAGFRETKLGTMTVSIMKKDPVAYKHFEYWECPKCYWNK